MTETQMFIAYCALMVACVFAWAFGTRLVGFLIELWLDRKTRRSLEVTGRESRLENQNLRQRLATYRAEYVESGKRVRWTR